MKPKITICGKHASLYNAQGSNYLRHYLGIATALIAVLNMQLQPIQKQHQQSFFHIPRFISSYNPRYNINMRLQQYIACSEL